MSNQNTFESVLLRLRRAVRRDQRRSKDAVPVGYLSPDGNTLLWTGDNDAPYVKVVNGPNEPVNVIISGGGGTSEVEGFTPHDDPDPGDENPVYIGGFATVAPRADVDEADRAGVSTDLESRPRARLSGKTPAGADADVPLDGTGAVTVGGQLPDNTALTGDENPVLIGAAVISSPSVGGNIASGNIVHLSTDPRSRLRSRVSGTRTDGVTHADVPLDDASALAVGGPTDHGDAYAGFPVVNGGIALEEAPAAVTDSDVVRYFADLVGRQQINHPLSFAGENPVHDVLMVSEKPLAVEDGALLSHYEVGTSEVVKAAAGRIYSAWAYNNSGGDAFLLIRNAVGTGAPSWTALRIPDGETGFVSFEDHGGLYFDTGITVMLSTSDNSFAEPGEPADSSIAARFF